MAVLSHTGPASLQVDRGEVVAVLGAPGSGKSRLAMELAFLQRPRQGEVLYNGTNPLAGARAVARRDRPRQVALLVQNAEDQLFARTVFDDVAFGPRRLGLDDDEIRDRVENALEAVRLDPQVVGSRSPFALSGGERRRAALAGVLAMRPEVLILDEPTANLDPQTRTEFRDLLSPLAESTAVVWLTSSAREAGGADRVYLLRNGQTGEVPGGAELLGAWPDLAEAGVEMPAVYELAAYLASRGYQLPAPASPQDVTAAIVGEWQRKHHAG